MNKLKQVALCLIILSIGGVAAAERPSAGFRPLDDAMRSMLAWNKERSLR